MSLNSIRNYLHYEPATGVFTWLARTSAKTEGGLRSWNTRYAGKKAGSILRIKGGPYWKIRILGRHYYAHRLAWLYMTGEMPERIDHRDLDGLNNRWRNLRVSTQSQNLANSNKRTSNTSGFKGVSFDAARNRYRAQITIDGRFLHLGYFDTPEEAAHAYDTAANDSFGEFALLNFGGPKNARTA